jgi:hypothetical protein
MHVRELGCIDEKKCEQIYDSMYNGAWGEILHNTDEPLSFFVIWVLYQYD